MVAMEKKRKNRNSVLSKIKRFLKVKYRRPVLNYLETHLVDHCNLKCKSCSHYSPLASEYYSDFNEYKKTLKLLSKKLTFKTIRLLGGEPLLHPQITKFLKCTRQFFPKSKISIVTNGSLLKNMPEEFWQTCRESKISMDLSKYPPFYNQFEDFINLIQAKSVNITDIHDCEKMFVFHNPNLDSNPDISYKNCGIKRYKVLKGTKLYSCPKSAYINIYNEYFNLQKQKDEGIDIRCHSAKSIIDKIFKANSICKSCSYSAMQIQWDYSKSVQNEWNVIDEAEKIYAFQQFILKEIEKK